MGRGGPSPRPGDAAQGKDDHILPYAGRSQVALAWEWDRNERMQEERKPTVRCEIPFPAGRACAKNYCCLLLLCSVGLLSGQNQNQEPSLLLPFLPPLQYYRDESRAASAECKVKDRTIFFIHGRSDPSRRDITSHAPGRVH